MDTTTQTNARTTQGEHDSRYRKYTWRIITITGFFALAALLFNATLDPLWYLKGNLIHGENYSFDERLTKTNVFLEREEQLDCIIFGSSRVTLLHETKIKNNTCFNFAFSGGRVLEFIAYADWVKARGFEPARVIVGLDDFNYWEDERNDTPRIPEFITELRNPPSLLTQYLTRDALAFSYRLLIQDELRPRYYDQDFIGQVQAGTPTFQPKTPELIPVDVNPNHINRYKTLREKFPNAHFTVYIPPLSPWELMKKTDEELQHYLSANIEISRFTDTFFDFSIPSELTQNNANTYDGDHFFPAVNDHIVAVLNGEPLQYGLRVDAHTEHNYRSTFLNALENFKRTEAAVPLSIKREQQ